MGSSVNFTNNPYINSNNRSASTTSSLSITPIVPLGVAASLGAAILSQTTSFLKRVRQKEDLSQLEQRLNAIVKKQNSNTSNANSKTLSPANTEPVIKKSEIKPTTQNPKEILPKATPSIVTPHKPKNIATLPKVPHHGIKVGLPNITDKGGFGNTCWLNSILKFISTGTEFDSMLVQKISPNAREAQAHFRDIISTLRTGKTPTGETVQSIPEKMYKDFLKSLKDLKKPDKNESIIPKGQGIGYQQDACEYLQAFGKAFEWQPFIESNVMQNIVNEERNFPRQATVFTPANDTPVDKKKLPKLDPSMAFIAINPPATLLNSKENIDLIELTEEREVRTARHIAEDPLSGNYDWNVYKCFTCLPSSMIVSLNRAVLADNAQASFGAALFQKKISNSINVDKDGLISFIEYKPIYEGKNIVEFSPSKICHYRIETALTHQGGANGGHYICDERAASGQMLRHSDMQVKAANDGLKFGTSGSLLRLKLVKKESLEQELPVAEDSHNTEKSSDTEETSDAEELSETEELSEAED